MTARSYRVLTIAVTLLARFSLLGQDNRDHDPNVTFRSTSSLVLVDVIVQDPKGEAPVNGLKQTDFEIRDNGQSVPIVAFDNASSYATHPVDLWLVVICNEGNNPDGSMKFAGKESLFRQALDLLQPTDRVGVAHWCDNGEAEVDLSPTNDRDAVTAALQQTLKPIPWVAPAPQFRRLGELAYQWLIELLIANANATKPEALPVMVFLHGDHTGQPIEELDQLLRFVLSTTGFVYGIKDAEKRLTLAKLYPGFDD